MEYEVADKVRILYCGLEFFRRCTSWETVTWLSITERRLQKTMYSALWPQRFVSASSLLGLTDYSLSVTPWLLMLR